MEDEDVVFEGSPLYKHLVDAGCGDFQCERKVSSSVDGKIPKRNYGTGKCDKIKKLGWWQEFKSIFNNYVFDESWQKQVQSLHKKSCDHILDASLKKRVLYEDDVTYVQSFASSISHKILHSSSYFSDSLYGQMFLQVAVLCVTIGYGFMRMFYAKSGPTQPPMSYPSSTHSSSTSTSHQNNNSGSYYSVLIYGLDLLSLLVIVAALLPATVKFSSVGRLVGCLDAFNSSFSRLLNHLESLRRLSAKSILFVQESEVIKRGYTLVTVPVSRLELGLNSCGERECLDLRTSIFYRNRNALLAIRDTSLSLLELFPDKVELRGVKQCLAKQDLKEFCSYLSSSNASQHSKLDDKDEEDILKLTDGYSLSSLKFLVELVGAHVSELVRLISLLCFIETSELSSTKNSESIQATGFAEQMSLLARLYEALDENLTPLDQCLNVSQTMRNKIADGFESGKERKKKGSGAGESNGKIIIRGMHVAVHSLKLHLESALRRVQINDEMLESLLDDGDGDDCGDNSDDNDGNAKSGPSESVKYEKKLVDDVTSEVKQLSRELKASRECLDELELIIAKITKTPKSNENTDPTKDASSDVPAGVQKDIPCILSSSVPVAEDEVFEAITEHLAKELKREVEDDGTLVEARQKHKDAARVISELRSVIAVRAKDTEERERKAFLKNLSNYQQKEQVEQNSQHNSQQIADDIHHGLQHLHDLSPLKHQPSPSTSPETTSQSTNGQHNASSEVGESKVENNFNGARPKERWDSKNAQYRKDRQYFGDRIDSSDSDSDEGNASSGHPGPHLPKSFQLRHRKPLLKSSTGNEVPPGSLDADHPDDPDGHSKQNLNGHLYSFGHHSSSSRTNNLPGNSYQGPCTMKGIAHMAASLSRRVNLGDEEMFGNDVDEDEDEDDIVGDDDVDDEDDEMNDADNDVSDSQSGDLDSDDIYHVTDDDEGFDGVNAGYDDDEDDEEKIISG